MAENKTGGAAFPQQRRDFDADPTGPLRLQGGMTLRDYFAAKAMQGFCANQAHSVLDGPDFFGEAAKEAYAMADAMLAAREGQA